MYLLLARHWCCALFSKANMPCCCCYAEQNDCGYVVRRLLCLTRLLGVRAVGGRLAFFFRSKRRNCIPTAWAILLCAVRATNLFKGESSDSIDIYSSTSMQTAIRTPSTIFRNNKGSRPYLNDRHQEQLRSILPRRCTTNVKKPVNITGKCGVKTTVLSSPRKPPGR